MDTAVSVLQSIYDVYKTIKDGQDQFHATYTRMSDLLGQLRAMEATETLVETRFLDKYLELARSFLAYLEKYKRRKFLSKVIHQSEMLAEVEGFNQELEALFQHFHLAMGAHIVEHSRAQETTMDELVRGMRVLLQGSTQQRDHQLTTAQLADDLQMSPASSAAHTSGPVATALAQHDIATLVAFLTASDDDNNNSEAAARALCELAEQQDAMRDKIVAAGAIPLLVNVLLIGDRGSAVRVHAARTLRRLAVRDIHETAIVEAGGIARLAAILLDAKSSTEAETSAACAALSQLGFQTSHKLVFLETPQLIARLVELVRSGTDSHKKHATNVLRELATSDACAAAIRDAHGITALVDLLHIATDATPCTSALEALWNLAATERNRREIAAVGGINAIVAQIRRESSSNEQRQLAASALAVLAQDDTNDALIGAAGGVELLASLLRTGTDGQKNSAAWALAELANDASNADGMVRTGMVPVLMAAFRSGSDIQRAKAGLALAWIAQLTDDKTALVAEIGVSGIVSMLRGSPDQRQNAAGIIVGIADHETYQRELGQLGAVELLVDLVTRHTPNSTAMHALRLLATDNDANKAAIGASGGIQAAVNALKTPAHHGDGGSTNDAEDHAFELLALISAHSTELRQQILSAGALPFILENMTHGSLDQQRTAAVLLNQLSEDIPANDDACSLAASTRALTMVLQPLDDQELDDELTETALNGLSYIAMRPEALEVFGGNNANMQMMLDLLSRADATDVHKHSAGVVLGNLAENETLATLLVDKNALEAFLPLLRTKSSELQSTAAYAVAMVASHEKLRKRISSIRGLPQRLVKLLDVGASDEVHECAAEALYRLASDAAIAAQLGLIHGLEQLVTLVESGSDTASYNAALALRNLANAHANIDMLVEIGAIDAAVALLAEEVEEVEEEAQMAMLELLAIMATDREAGEAMVGHGGVVALCVDALQSETREWNDLGLAILMNLHALEEMSQPEEEEEEEEGGRAPEGVEDDGEWEDEDGEEEGQEELEDVLSYLAQIIDAGGLEPLVELLEEPGSRTAGLIRLLTALALESDAAKLKVGGSVGLFVEIVHGDGSIQDGQQLSVAAAILVATLVAGSKRNAAAALRARVDDAFIHFITTNNDTQAATTATGHLLTSLVAIKTAPATTAVAKIVKALAVSALTDTGPNSAGCYELLVKLLAPSSSSSATAGFGKAFVEAGAATVCVNALTGDTSSESVTRAVALLHRVSRTKCRTALMESGAVAALAALLNNVVLDKSPMVVDAAKATLASLGATAF